MLAAVFDRYGLFDAYDYTVAAAAEDEHGWLLASMSHEDKRLGQNGDGR